MTRDEVEFIIETLEVAIDWSSYADDYFKEKHNRQARETEKDYQGPWIKENQSHS